MSVQTQLAEMMAIAELTVPVMIGDGPGELRGFKDEAADIAATLNGKQIERNATVVYLMTAQLPDVIDTDAPMLVGPVGGDTAVVGSRYRIAHQGPYEDGEITMFVLAKGRGA